MNNSEIDMEVDGLSNRPPNVSGANKSMNPSKLELAEASIFGANIRGGYKKIPNNIVKRTYRKYEIRHGKFVLVDMLTVDEFSEKDYKPQKKYYRYNQRKRHNQYSQY